uniref:RNase H type-1 domain-containing protein n=1 Tax=Fagus sylvatica TaxID=28930 RepID=A0A2N9H2T2_FAGSY
MNQDKSLWDVEVLKNLFEEVSVQAILDIPRWSTDHPDRWIWVKTSNGAFSVKSAFKEASKEIQPSLVNPVLGLHSKHCDVARALWFGGGWTIRTDAISISNSLQLVDFLISPPLEVSDLWRNHWALSKALVFEHRGSRLIPQSTPPSYKISVWQVPPSGCLKFNYDAAVGPSFSSIALVARDWRGKVVLALSKKAYTMNPLQAKAEAIL